MSVFLYQLILQENEISASESKRHGREKLVKSYEEKLKKLEQRFEEETKVRLAIEEQLQASGEQERAKFHDLQTELREKESELAELAKLLQTVQEQLCEQETKREESQRKLELLQKTTALQTSKSQTVEKLEKEVDEFRAELEARDQEVRELKGKERESSPHARKEVKKLKREVDEKLRSRDKELSDLKKGNTPFVDASLSPTDSMTADSSEVVELKLKMRERETELENLRRQVQSMEQVLLELNRLRKVSENLRMENEKLLHRSKSVSDHSKRQSEQIMALRKQLETRPVPVSSMYSFT